MTNEEKNARIHTLRYLVASRWFLHAGIVLLGVVQKVIGVAEFNPNVFALIFCTYGYNLAYYLYLHQPKQRMTARGLYLISLLQVVFDQIIYTIVLYTTGGVESISFLFYFISIFMAITILNEWEIISVTFFTVLLYVGVIVLEYRGLIPHYLRYNFNPGFYHNIGVTVQNSATVVLILIFTAFFAAFISNVLRNRQASIMAERDKLFAIIDNLVDGIILLDAHGRVMLVNPYAQHILHMQPQQLLKGHFQNHAISPALKPLLQFIEEAANQQTAYHSKELTIDDDNQHLVLQLTALAVTDSHNKHIGALVIMRNITREKDLDRMKSDFISVAAHQLRTPLATLKWLFSILLEGDEGKLTDKQTDLVKKGSERNNEVIEIVNNLLDVSEIEEGRFSLKLAKASLVDLVNQIVHDSQVNAERNHIKLRYHPPANLAAVRYDRQKLRIAIQNLIDNAIKYSRPGQTVTITLQQPAHSKIIELHVADHGIGMSEASQAKLFNKFFRGKEAIIKEPTGSGLGLYIVRSIVEKHGGSIQFTSQLDHGTTFVLSLPIAS